MLVTRRVVLAGLAVSVLGACARIPIVPDAAEEGLTLVDAFSGTQRGSGRFNVPITGYERTFDVVLTGTVSGDTLTVREEFDWSDGEQQVLTWRFTRAGAGRWTGTREDVIGEAVAIETGTEIRLDYTADIVANGDTTRLSFSDILYRRPDGAIVNEALVLAAGVPVGNVELLIGPN